MKKVLSAVLAATMLLALCVALAVPASAIMNDGKKDFVYVVTADNTVVLRPVLTGELQGNMQIIRKGLNIGDTIVTEGTHKVIPDGKSKIVPVMDK